METSHDKVPNVEMSFTASTVPGSKHQFLSSLKKGGTLKMLTPKNTQLPTLIREDSKKTTSTPTTNRSQKQLESSRGDTIVKGTSKIKENKQAVSDQQVSTHKEDKTIKESPRPASKSVVSELEAANGNDIWVTSKSKYDEMVFLRQRHELRIESLEADLKEVLQYYEMLYKENEILKEKLNVEEQIVAEPYKAVYNDRDVLRTAEFAYRKRITHLQKELKEKEKEILHFKEDVKRLKSKLPNTEKEKEKEAKYNRMFWENRDLKVENHNLIKKIGILADDVKFYKSQKVPDWNGFFTSTGEGLLHKTEADGENDQRFAILEHEAKKLIAELEDSVETLNTKVENLTEANKSLIKTNKQMKRTYDEAVKKCDSLKIEKLKLDQEIKLLKYRLGEINSSKGLEKETVKHDNAKILKRFKQTEHETDKKI